MIHLVIHTAQGGDTHRPAETAQHRPVTTLSLVGRTYRHLHLFRRVSAGAGGQRPHDRGRGGSLFVRSDCLSERLRESLFGRMSVGPNGRCSTGRRLVRHV